MHGGACLTYFILKRIGGVSAHGRLCSREAVVSQPDLLHDLNGLVRTATVSQQEVPKEEAVEVSFEVIETPGRPPIETETPPKEHEDRKSFFFGSLLWAFTLLIFAGFMFIARAWPASPLVFLGAEVGSGAVLIGTGVLSFLLFCILILRLCPDRYTDGSWETAKTKELLKAVRGQKVGHALVRPRWTRRTYMLNRYRIGAILGSLAIVTLGVAQALLGYGDGRMVEEMRNVLSLATPASLVSAVVCLVSGTLFVLGKAALRSRV